MASATFFIVLFCIVGYSFGAAVPEDNLKTNIVIVNDIEVFKAANPGVELIKLEKNDLSRAQILYTLGNRVNGDRLVAQSSRNQQWSTAQNVQLALQYPQSGTGAVVTFVQVSVTQSSNQGQGYVAAGGIGQRYITIVIEAYNTTVFNYVAQIFGY